MPISIGPDIPVARLGEASHLAGQRQWAERQRQRQLEIELARQRMAQQQGQFNQQLQAQMFGRQQALEATNQQMMFGAQQQAARQQQQFQNQQALGQQRSEQLRSNYEFLNQQRHEQQIAYSNHRDADKIMAAEQAYQNPQQALNPAGQNMARKIRLMEDKIDGDETLNAGERELAKMKLARRKMVLTQPQFQKEPERQPFMPNPHGAGFFVLNPKTGGYEYKIAPHQNTGQIKEHTLPDGRKIHIQMDKAGEWKPLISGGSTSDRRKALSETWDWAAEYKAAEAALTNRVTGTTPKHKDIVAKMMEKKAALEEIEQAEENDIRIREMEQQIQGPQQTQQMAPGTDEFVQSLQGPIGQQRLWADQGQAYMAPSDQQWEAEYNQAMGWGNPNAQRRVSAEKAKPAEDEQPLTSPDQIKSHPRYIAAKPGETVVFKIRTAEGVTLFEVKKEAEQRGEWQAVDPSTGQVVPGSRAN